MNNQITTGAVHHVVLTVNDVKRACEFYTSLLGFKMAVELGQRILLSNGSVVLALRPTTEFGRGHNNDRFDEDRVGLDHVSLGVANRDELERAVRVFDQRGVQHGAIKDLSDLGLYVLAFRDPDNIQMELTAPRS